MLCNFLSSAFLFLLLESLTLVIVTLVLLPPVLLTLMLLRLDSLTTVDSRCLFNNSFVDLIASPPLFVIETIVASRSRASFDVSNIFENSKDVLSSTLFDFPDVFFSFISLLFDFDNVLFLFISAMFDFADVVFSFISLSTISISLSISVTLSFLIFCSVLSLLCS